MSILTRPILAGSVVEATADNALATATVAGVTGVTHYIAGAYADYSADPTAGWKTIVFKKGSTTIMTLRWDFVTTKQALINLPVELKGEEDGAVSCELQASGTGAVIGSIKLFTHPD
jgi:hypothetical protein